MCEKEHGLKTSPLIWKLDNVILENDNSYGSRNQSCKRGSRRPVIQNKRPNEESEPASHKPKNKPLFKKPHYAYAA
eukprot:Ihof_evm1s229 gene=Ihof_evmTU1s229